MADGTGRLTIQKGKNQVEPATVSVTAATARALRDIRPYDRDSATAFYTLVSARYERGSIILTSNKGFGVWGELLGDTVIASAILDWLLHHSHVLNIRGES